MLEYLSAPLEVRGEVTSACNLRCLHCYNGSEKAGDNEMGLSEWKNVIDQLVEMGVPDILFEGGEPLLWPHMISLLRYASQKPIRTSLSTNGTLITPELARELHQSVAFVQVSIDGANAETHDRIRGVPGTFARAVASVRYLVSEGVPVVISMVLMRPNASQVEEYARLGAELGVAACGFMRFHPTGRGQKNSSDLALGRLEFRDAIKRVIALRGQVPGIDLKVEKLSFPFLLLGDFRWDEAKLPLTKCVECADSLAVLSDGSIVPCPVLRSLVAGNARTDRLATVYRDSETYKHLRQVRVHESCTKCRHFPGCRGGCRCYALLEYGDLGDPDPGCWINPVNLARSREAINRR